jgi:hypothetical protein
MNIADLLGAAMNKNDAGAVTLGQLIDTLEAAEPTRVVVDGFGEPDSWRGVYAFLAFAPKNGTTVAEMLAHAKSAVGSTYTGYKGGDFTMTRETPCHIAAYGVWGGDEDAITPGRLANMLGVAVADEKPSLMPKRPPLMVGYCGDDAIVSPSQIEAFQAYVAELEALCAKLLEQTKG